MDPPRKITAGEFRNLQYNNLKKTALSMACIVTLMAGIFILCIGSDVLLEFLKANIHHIKELFCFFFLSSAITLWVVYFAAKEQANNKLWEPDDPTDSSIDYRTKGHVK